MPIFCPIALRPVAQEEFVRMDYRLMRCAFDCQNQLVDQGSQLLQSTLLELLVDWGGFLELSLYTEALVHLLGGKAKVVQKIELFREGISLGTQRFHLLSPETAFRLTALASGTEEYEAQLLALLHHSQLATLQWVNLGRHRVQFITLQKGNS